MYLKKLQIQGFKSFADKTELQFGSGMTVIAGPNGSGKSNVTDAIRWVLGEQAASSLRARKAEDIIWVGSERKRPAGFAEVTLTFNNASRWLPSDYTDVAITRRVHRDGQSDYLLNKRKVRLSDLHDLLAKAQVRQGSYSYLSQGLVDKVLSLKPDQRRALIEEAADLHSSRSKLKLSERRLKETRDNLGHARAQVREIEPRIRSLKRQSKRAERYRTIKTALDSALHEYFFFGLRKYSSTVDTLKDTLSHAKKNTEVAQSEFSGLQTEYGQIRTALELARSESAVAKQDEQQKREIVMQYEQDIALLEQRIELSRQRKNDVSERLSSEKEFSYQFSANDVDTDIFNERELLASSHVEQRRNNLTEADRAVRDTLQNLAELEARRNRHLSDLDSLKSTLGTTRDAQTANIESIKRDTDRREYLVEELNRMGLKIFSLQEEIAATGELITGSLNDIDKVQIRLAESRRATEEGAANLVGSNALIGELEERISFLQNLMDESTLLADSLKFLESSSDPMVVDVISRLIEVPEEYRTAVDSWLGTKLGAIVVSSRDGLERIVASQSISGASGLMFYSNEDSAVDTHQEDLARPNEPQLVDQISLHSEMSGLLRSLFADVYIVADIKAGLRISELGFSAVMTDGTVFSADKGVKTPDNTEEHLSLVVGVTESLSKLAKEKEINLVLQNVLTEARSISDQLELDLRDSKAVHLSISAEKEILVDKLVNLEKERADTSSELNILETSIATSEARHFEESELLASIKDTEALTRSLDAEIADMNFRVKIITDERDSAAAEFESSSSELAAIIAERNLQERQVAEREMERQNRIALMQDLELQLGQLDSSEKELILDLESSKDKLRSQKRLFIQVKESIAPIETRVSDLSEKEAALESSRAKSESELRDTESRMRDLQFDLEKQEDQLERIRNEMREEEVSLDTLVQPILQNLTEQESDNKFSEAQIMVRESRSQLRSLGPVNIDALDELEEINERYEFLTLEMEDLESALTELRAVIKDLKSEIQRSFIETFEQVNHHFKEYFVRFFGGGYAELKLVTSEPTAVSESDAESTDVEKDSSLLESGHAETPSTGEGVLGGDLSLLPNDKEAGVEIYAQPPGKKVTRLAALSGGERSLTSVALLFALLAVNPSPIVVLDEVDAALDESNIGRFITTVRDFTENTQFLVVSHSRLTIEAADSIYGVSMGNDSASQVLSMQISETNEQNAA